MNESQIPALIKKMLESQQLIKSVNESADFPDGEEFYFTYPEDKYSSPRPNAAAPSTRTNTNSSPHQPRTKPSKPKAGHRRKLPIALDWLLLNSL